MNQRSLVFDGYGGSNATGNYAINCKTAPSVETKMSIVGGNGAQGAVLEEFT